MKILALLIPLFLAACDTEDRPPPEIQCYAVDKTNGAITPILDAAFVVQLVHDEVLAPELAGDFQCVNGLPQKTHRVVCSMGGTFGR